MPKKKSYMDNKNIIEEGFFDNLLRIIIPKSIKQKIDKKKQAKLKKELEKSEKKIKDLETKQKQLQKSTSKHLEKQYGIKMSDKELRDYWKKQIYGD